MRKFFVAAIIMVIVLFSFNANAAEKSKSFVFNHGAYGGFCFNPDDGSFQIKNELDGKQYMDGIISPSTRIIVDGRPSLKFKNLDLLNGKMVYAIGKFKQTGAGERTRIKVLAIHIVEPSKSDFLNQHIARRMR